MSSCFAKGRASDDSANEDQDKVDKENSKERTQSLVEDTAETAPLSSDAQDQGMAEPPPLAEDAAMELPGRQEKQTCPEGSLQALEADAMEQAPPPADAGEMQAAASEQVTTHEVATASAREGSKSTKPLDKDKTLPLDALPPRGNDLSQDAELNECNEPEPKVLLGAETGSNIAESGTCNQQDFEERGEKSAEESVAKSAEERVAKSSEEQGAKSSGEGREESVLHSPLARSCRQRSDTDDPPLSQTD